MNLRDMKTLFWSENTENENNSRNETACFLFGGE